MSFDTVIKGGRIADGSGAPMFSGDIAISNGVIQEIGQVSPNGARIIDADGALVAPGFVDIHTHYDGQACWDETLSPSALNGVTTTVMGNCGVGFAPLRPGEQGALIELMEGVEEIPGVALAEGLDWDWEDFASYLDAVDRIPHAIDIVAQATHDPIRLYVMGARGAAGEAATPEDLAAMRRLVAEAISVGARGVSTGRTDIHRTAKGNDTPARNADAAELAALAAGVADARAAGHAAVMQVVSDFRLADGPDAFDAEFDLVDQMAEVSGAPVSMTTVQRDLDQKQWQRILGRIEAGNERGLTLRGQVSPRGIGTFLGLETTLNPLMVYQSYRAIADLPLSERVKRMRDPAVKASILADPVEKLSAVDPKIPELADIVMGKLDFFALRMFPAGRVPDYEPDLQSSIYCRARDAGISVPEMLYDTLLEDDGHQLLYFPIHNYSAFNLDAVAAMLTHPLALSGLSDSGAHVGTVCDAGFPTFLLSHWARDRKKGDPLALEKLIAMQTSRNAEHMQLGDRGRLAPGLRADINVIDFDRLGQYRPDIVHDLPGGGRRLLQKSQGYLATLVAGAPIVEHDRMTGARPGRLVR